MELTTVMIVRIIVCALVSLILWLMSRGNWAAGSFPKRFALFVVGVIVWVGIVGMPLYGQWRELRDDIEHEEMLNAYDVQMTAEIRRAAGELRTTLVGDLAGPMALYPFHEQGRTESVLGNYLSEKMIAPVMVAFSGLCTFVERERLEDALRELDFQDSDLTNKAKTYELGQLIGARYILIGTITVLRSDQFELFLRILEVEEGVILSAVNARMPYSPELREALAGEEIR